VPTAVVRRITFRDIQQIQKMKLEHCMW